MKVQVLVTLSCNGHTHERGEVLEGRAPRRLYGERMDRWQMNCGGLWLLDYPGMLQSGVNGPAGLRKVCKQTPLTNNSWPGAPL